MKSTARILRLLTGAFAVVTGLLTLSALVDLVPAQYAGMAAGFTSLLLGLKEFIVGVGDYLDDGVRNNSFNPAKVVKVLLCLLLPAGLLMSCASAKSTDNQLRFAQTSLDLARVSYVIADSQLQTKLLDPKTPLWQRVAARAASDQARKSLEREELRVQRLIADRDVLPLPVLTETVTYPLLPLGQ